MGVGLGVLVLLTAACGSSPGQAGPAVTEDSPAATTPAAPAVSTTVTAAPTTTVAQASTTVEPPAPAAPTTTETTVAPTTTRAAPATAGGASTVVTTVPDETVTEEDSELGDPDQDAVGTSEAPATMASAAPTTTASPSPTATESMPATTLAPYDDQPYHEAVDAFVAVSTDWLAAPAIGDCMARSSGQLPVTAKDLIVDQGLLGAIEQMDTLGAAAFSLGQVWSDCMAESEQVTAASQPGSGSGSGSGSGTACAGSLTTLPVARDQIMGVVPLGHLAPPSHTQSTDHIYFLLPGYEQQEVPSVPVVSPGAGSIVKLANFSSNTTGTEFIDWQVEISTCTDGSIKFGHMTTITAELQALTEGPAESCNTYGYTGYMHTSCTWMGQGVNLSVSAGQQIGTAGGLGTPNTQLDMWVLDWAGELAAAIDQSAQPESILRAGCGLDWFAADLRTDLYSIRMESSGILADEATGCGKVFQDVVGTAKGFWYSVTPVEGKWLDNLALVDTNTRSDHQAISVAALVADPGYWIFQTRSAGTVNRDFAQVTAGSGVHCYDSFTADSNGPTGATDRFLIEVVDTDTLRIEHQGGSCGASPSFTSPYLYSRYQG
jgi:hypothetical protein